MHRIQLLLVTILTIAGLAAFCAGCGPRPPLHYQPLQVQDSEESEGYDVYLYVAVRPGLPEESISGLLEWFRDVKYSGLNRLKVFVWDNPQSALTNSTGDLVGTLTVDREQGIDQIITYP